MNIWQALLAITIAFLIGVETNMIYSKDHPSDTVKMKIYHEAYEDMASKYWMFSAHHRTVADSINKLFRTGKKVDNLYDLGYWSGKADGIGDGMNTITDRMRTIDNSIINLRQ